MAMNREDCQVGMEVLYEPSPGHKFKGTVASQPWELYGGTWVTKLVFMERGYSDHTGKKTGTVHAAALARLEPYAKE